MISAERSAAVRGEPFGRRLWLVLVAVVAVTACLQSYGIATWPMADDEVPTLAELGRFKVPPRLFSVPSEQVARLRKAIPVYYSVQGFSLNLLPDSELSLRIPSLVWGILTSAVLFIFAARWRGLAFAVALSIIVGGSPLFILVSQVNRFYALPFLLVVLILGLIWLPRGGPALAVAVAGLAALTVLSHNITVLVLVLVFLASCATLVVRRVPQHVAWRSGAAALVSVLLYVFFVRPLMQGWQSTGNPTPVLISFAAHAGMPALSLALAGCWLSVVHAAEDRWMIWWAFLFAGSLSVMQIVHINWNPRYFLFFLPALWVLAAHTMDVIQRRLGSPSFAVAWYGVVVVLLLPSLLSHFQDGSRHDYRRAAAVLMDNALPGQPILSDDAETLSYYLPQSMHQHLNARTKVTAMPVSEFYLVVRSNAWLPLPVIPNRRMNLIAEISRRRFDQFSHILRVYRVTPVD